MERKGTARSLVVSALACFALFVLVGAGRATTVQNQNSSSGGFAQSGDARVSNTATVNVGPSANASGGPAQASQIGSNHVVVEQTGVAKSGDAVANAQITGVVGGGDVTIQNQNVGVGGVALSGVAEVSNTAFVNVGPFAGNSLVTGTALASQIGDNDVVIRQSALAFSGDAVVNSQINGVVGGDATVQGQNAADGGLAASGFAGAGNGLFGAGIGPTTSGPVATGLASQNGDNLADIGQHNEAGSGDAVSGSQVDGVVGDRGSFAVVEETHAGF